MTQNFTLKSSANFVRRQPGGLKTKWDWRPRIPPNGTNMEPEERGPRWIMHLGDFANMLKAFIGSNYLGVAYAFKQSGLLLGIGCLLIIASLTDHCCHLIVKTKYHAMRRLLAQYKAKRQLTSSQDRYQPGNRLDCSGYSFGSATSDSESEVPRAKIVGPESPKVDIEVDDVAILEKHMMRHMSYGDVGRMSFGGPGLFVVNLFIGTTQFCFCVAYFIFIGNTFHRLFPVNVVCVTNMSHFHPAVLPSTTTLPPTMLFHNLHAGENSVVDTSQLDSTIAALNITTNPYATTSVLNITIPESNISTTMLPSNITLAPSHNVSTTTPPSNITLAPSHNVSTTTPPSNITLAPSHNVSTTTPPSNITLAPWHNVSTTPSTEICTHESTAPDLKLLVLTPLPIFLVFALIRSIRNLSGISVVANVSILGGCVAVFLYMATNFSVSKYKLMNWDGVPLFFGMVTASYEGIGLIIPVESSMEGNRHNFNNFLHGAVGVLTIILGAFGTMGYMMFGDGVQQMINLNIPSTEWVAFAVNIGVSVGVLLTFPLQIYPVIELIEIVLFSEGSICGPTPKKDRLLQDEDLEESLLPHATKDLPITVAVHIPDSVAAWKRNTVRILVVGAAVGLAILFRNSFAYIGGFTGAVGSSALAFILPCVFHLKLCGKDLSYGLIVKDILIIVFGLAASSISLVYVLRELFNKTSV